MIRLFNDLLGDYVDIPDQLKIVSLAPSNTDILYHIGAWKHVYGVSVFCNYPPEARSLPRVGSYTNVIYSKLYEINPNLILTTSGVQRKLTQELKSRGFNVCPTLLPTSFYGIFENITFLGTLLNLVENAYKVIDRCTRILGEIKNETFMTVYFEVNLGSPITIGSGTYISSALYHIGLKNIFIDTQKSYFEPSFPEVAKADPDIIIYEVGYNEKKDYEELVEIFRKRGWSRLKAVRNKRIYILPPDTLTHYGPLLFDNLKKLYEEIIEEW